MFKIRKKEAIKLYEVNEREFTSINDFLNHFYCTNKRYAYYSSKTLPTRYVELQEGNVIQQCDQNRLRSPRDLAILIKYYFPQASYVEILKEIVTFVFKSVDDSSFVRAIQFRTCGDIQSPNIQTFRFHYRDSKDRYIQQLDFSKREYCSTLTYKGTKVYNWQKILDYIGMTNEEVAIAIYEKASKIFNPNI